MPLSCLYLSQASGSNFPKFFWPAALQPFLSFGLTENMRPTNSLGGYAVFAGSVIREGFGKVSTSRPFSSTGFFQFIVP
jgi:hypothetical protein